MSWSWIRPAAELRALSQDPAYAKVVAEMQGRVAYWMEHFDESPGRLSGWGHDYVCPTCATRLVFDREKPLEHRCTTCKVAVENTTAILRAWTYFCRSDIATTLLDAAVLYRMHGDATHREFVLRVIDYYATHYMEFNEHGTHAGRGRVMEQSLCEAVWGDHLLRALIVLGFDGASEMGQRWHRQLFLPAARMVAAQTSMIHNIPLWHQSFALGAGLFFGDERLAVSSLDGDLGARNQVLEGFTPDGIWFENSTAYHFYALEAATTVCLFLRQFGRVDSAIFERVISGYTAFLKLLFHDKSMPAFNDGWLAGNDLFAYAKVYLGAARLFEGMEGADRIAAAVADYDTTGTLGEFLYGKAHMPTKPEAYGSVNLPSNCMGMLRSELLDVYVKYGNLSRSHAHPDALQICLPPFALDLGDVGYGSVFHREWFTKTAAHATFLIDGKNQRSEACGTGTLSADGTAFDLTVSDAYDGVHAQRHLKLQGAQLQDDMRITAGAPCQIDWLFHSVGDFACGCASTPDTLPETTDGFGYFADVRRYEGPFQATFTAEGRTLTLSFAEIPANAKVYVATTPGNPTDVLRHTVLVRTQAQEVAIRAIYQVK